MLEAGIKVSSVDEVTVVPWLEGAVVNDEMIVVPPTAEGTSVAEV